MRRAPVALLLLAPFAISGCVSWKDDASARAFTACEKIADAEERRLCRQSVISQAEEDRQKYIDADTKAQREDEEREVLRQVYGDPGKVK